MNRDKARDFFSAYADGTLDEGLKASLERSLQNDRELREEYESFRQIWDELHGLRFVTPDIPDNLHDRIRFRLEDHVEEVRQRSTPTWLVYLRNTAVAGLAAAALAFAAIGITQGGPTATAGFSGNLNQLEARTADDGLWVSYHSSEARTLIVKDGLSGEELKRSQVQGRRWERLLKNDRPEAALFQVTALGDPTEMLVAVPGRRVQRERTGQGTLRQLARSVSDVYRIPVVIRGAVGDRQLKWTLDGSDPQASVVKTLGNTEYSVELRNGSMLWIVRN